MTDDKTYLLALKCSTQDRKTFLFQKNQVLWAQKLTRTQENLLKTKLSQQDVQAGPNCLQKAPEE